MLGRILSSELKKKKNVIEIVTFIQRLSKPET